MNNLIFVKTYSVDSPNSVIRFDFSRTIVKHPSFVTCIGFSTFPIGIQTDSSFVMTFSSAPALFPFDR